MKLSKLLLASALLALPTAWGQMSIPVNELKPALNDAEWQKRFIGSYGFLSDAEPKVEKDEVELLQDLLELMSVDTNAAAVRLSQEIKPDSSAALYFVLANLQLQNDKRAEAVKNYQIALEKFPDFRRVHKNLALILVQDENFKEAQKHMAKALELGEKDGRFYGLLGYCYMSEGEYLSASEAYSLAIMQQPDVRDWKLGLASSLIQMKKFEDAAALFDSLIAKDPQNASYWMHQSNAYLGLDRPLDAAVNLETVRVLGGSSKDSLVLLGDIYMNESMAEEALSAYQEAINVDNNSSPMTFIRVADLFYRIGQYEKSMQIIDQIEAKYGASMTTDQKLQVLTVSAKDARALGDQAKAVEILEEIVNQDGTMGDALLELASFYETDGQPEKAQFYYERAANLEKYRYKALIQFGQFLVRQKDYKQAIEKLRESQGIKQEPRVEAYLAKVESAAKSQMN